MRVVDVSNPFAPREISFIDTPGYAREVLVFSGRAYVADSKSGLRILDVSDPAAPREIGHYLPPGPKVDIRGVDVVGRFAYLAAGYAGLFVVDISHPANPRGLPRSGGPRSARTVVISGSYAYTGDHVGVQVFDVSNPSSLREVASYKTPSHVGDIWVAEGKAYVAAYEAGLMILGSRSGLELTREP